MRITVRNVIAAMGLLGLVACGGETTMMLGSPEQLPTLKDVTPAQWAALGQQRIFFGHQSVGGNILEGVAELMKTNPEIPLKIVETRSVTGATGAGIHHALVGRNDYPIEKFDDFVTLASSGFGQKSGIAMLKLCYTDIHSYTDPQKLFDDYQKRVADLKARNPSLSVVHFTVPLTGIENWKGRLMATVRGNSTQRERNVLRNKYNELLRKAYEGREPLFDIARLESTLPDGSRAFFGNPSEPVFMMASQYTNDGGHLNAEGRRRVAEQFLIMLARMTTPGAAAPRT